MQNRQKDGGRSVEKKGASERNDQKQQGPRKGAEKSGARTASKAALSLGHHCEENQGRQKKPLETGDDQGVPVPSAPREVLALVDC